MDSSEQTNQLTRLGETAKRPYLKPEVRYEHVFETMALSCGKVGGTQASCHFVRKTS